MTSQKLQNHAKKYIEMLRKALPFNKNSNPVEYHNPPSSHVHDLKHLKSKINKYSTSLIPTEYSEFSPRKH